VRRSVNAPAVLDVMTSEGVEANVNCVKLPDLDRDCELRRQLGQIVDTQGGAPARSDEGDIITTDCQAHSNWVNSYGHGLTWGSEDI
jgi:hypothetical protein